jgi:hypothetical protein
MTCLLCNQPFGENTITLDCGHTFDKTCLRQDFFNKSEILEPCTCPICLKPYNSSLLINVYIPTSKIQRERILKIQDLVRKRAYELDEEHQREHPLNKYTPAPTKESMDEAKLMYKQRIKQKEQRRKEKQEELILQQKAVIQQKEELILEQKAVIQQKEELIVELKGVIKQKEEQNEEQEELIVQQNAIIQQLSRPPQPPNRRVF